MCHRRLASFSRFAWIVTACAFLAFTGCSQEEHLEADPGVSPFYPGSIRDRKPLRPKPKRAIDQGSAKPGVDSAKDSAAAGGPAVRRGSMRDSEPTRSSVCSGSRFERHRKGDPAAAAEQLDKVLAIEPINREALTGRASVALKQANAATGVSDRAAAIEKAEGLVRALMRLTTRSSRMKWTSSSECFTPKRRFWWSSAKSIRPSPRSRN